MQCRYFIYTVASSSRHKDLTYLWRVLNNQTLIIPICKTKHRDLDKKGHCFRESDFTVWSLWDPTPSKSQQFSSASHICWLWFAKHLSREERCTCRRSVGGLIHKLQVRWARCKESALHTVLILQSLLLEKKKTRLWELLVLWQQINLILRNTCCTFTNVKGIIQKVIENYSQPAHKAHGFQLHWLNTLHQTQYEQFFGTDCWPWVVSIDHKLGSLRVYTPQAAMRL